MTAIRFDRREWAGAFGDIGTDLPLLAAMVIAADMHAPTVFMVFGLMQVLTGFIYRIPMPVQPLKAMAALVISQHIAGPVLLGAGLAIGGVMFLLAATGLLDGLARLVPRAVVRGLQLGLGISLSLLACKEYIPADGQQGYLLAAGCFVILILLKDHIKYPGALIVVALGVVYALLTGTDDAKLASDEGGFFRDWAWPDAKAISQGFILLALPQIPLSLGNSILATKQLADDLFPERGISIKKIGLTYALMNLVVPVLGGVPVCHGSGGMAGHYTFGGRTGGSVIIYGMLYLLMGLFLALNVKSVIEVFPLPMLGVILLFEGVALAVLVADLAAHKRDFFIAVLVGVLAVGLPYGFLLAMVVGTALYYYSSKWQI